MSSLIIINQHYKHFPLVIAANRDEDYRRKTSPVQALTREPHLIFGEKDERKGGTFLAVNQYSLFAAITNQGTKNPKLASRALIIMDLLKCKSLDDMISFVEEINPSLYNKFNLVFGNAKAMFVAHSYMLHSMVISEISKGVNLITNDMKFNIESDYKRDFMHESLDHVKDISWAEYYIILKNILSDTESGMRLLPKKNKKTGNIGGRCTRSSNILTFDDNGLARFKYYDRTTPRPKQKENESKLTRYKDYIDQFRDLIGAKKNEKTDEESYEENIKDIVLGEIAKQMSKGLDKYITFNGNDWVYDE